MLRLYEMIAGGADCVLLVRPPKNMVGGRYLATFSCNSFWNQQKIGSGVGSGTGFGSDLLAARTGKPTLHP